MEQKKPNKTNKGKKPLTKKPASSVSNDDIKSLLKEVMMKSIEEQEIKKEIELDSITATLEEFLKCFIVVGYSLDNEPVLITSAASQLDADALSTHFTKVFMNMHGNHGGI